jgi:ribosomal protein L12E/L44/L45/RPP1/RPP2
MKKWQYLTEKKASELCEKLNRLGVEPAGFVSAGNGERVTAYYYAEEPKKAEPAKKEEPKKEEKAEEPKKADAAPKGQVKL